MAAPRHVVVSTPCYGGLVTHHTMLSTINLMLAGLRDGVSVSVELLGDSLVTRARNTLVARFLDREAATHLLFVDADIGFDPVDVGRMLALDEPVVAGAYPLKDRRWTAEAIGRVQAGEHPDTAPLRYVGVPCTGGDAAERDGFVTALFAGTGLMLIRRDALMALLEAHPELRYATAHDGPDANPSPHQAALFDGGIDPDTRHYLSEDYMFCRRWRALGGRIWLDTRARLTHAGSHDFVGDPGRRADAWR